MKLEQFLHGSNLDRLLSSKNRETSEISRVFKSQQVFHEYFGLSLLAMFLLVAGSMSACGGSDDDTTPVGGDTDQEIVADQPEAESDEAVSACWDDLAPGQKEIFAEGFASGSEGIAFGPDGKLYVTAGDIVLRFEADGQYETFADTPDAVGCAFWGEDLWATGFGEDRLGDTVDGELFQIASDGSKTSHPASANPNFVATTPWGTLLMSDESGDVIYSFDESGAMTEWLSGTPTPNGMVFSPDGKTLYIADTYTSNGRVYVVPVDESGTPGDIGELSIATNCADNCVNDGLAMGASGTLYVAANGAGSLIAVPTEGDPQTMATDILSPASLAFGNGEGFDPCSIYITELFGSKIWRVAVGEEGAPLPGTVK